MNNQQGFTFEAEAKTIIVCDLCTHYLPEGKCRLELRIPTGMSCREYLPSLHKFCDNPKDFVDSNQVIEMSKFFGMKGTELKKVRLMAARVEMALANEQDDSSLEQPFATATRKRPLG